MIERCRHRSDFRRVDDEGRRRSGRYIWVRGVVDESLRAPRVAFAIGRRNGNAVTRNRIRRRLRAALSARSAAIAPGIYLIGWRSSGSQEPDFPELLEDVDQTFAALSTPARRG
ncbi:MAG: ribonuclease P protein component [Acidimicrobiales bacterium]|nr:ribonuclease P protein component [Acidimicrobiales bacterium]